jgi:hypothetical protein
VEGEGGEAGPQPAPPAGEDAGAGGGGGAVEAGEDLEKKILREGADEIRTSALRTSATTARSRVAAMTACPLTLHGRTPNAIAILFYFDMNEIANLVKRRENKDTRGCLKLLKRHWFRNYCGHFILFYAI